MPKYFGYALAIVMLLIAFLVWVGCHFKAIGFVILIGSLLSAALIYMLTMAVAAILEDIKGSE